MVILVLLGVIYSLFNSPLDSLTPKKAKTKTGTAQTDTPKHLSFSGVSGGSVEPDPEKAKKDSLCYTGYFTSKGKVYVLLKNGKAIKAKKGMSYEECQ